MFYKLNFVSQWRMGIQNLLHVREVLAIPTQMQTTHLQPNPSEPQNFCKNLGDIQEKHWKSFRKLKVTLKITYSTSTYKTNLER